MSYQYPDRISVEEFGEVEVTVRYAILTVTIEGEFYVFGDEALKKSKELASFISDLKTTGYSAENLALKKIAIQTTSGKLLKSSTARFTVLLDKIKPEIVPNILGIISGQKNIAIVNLDYDFGELEQERSQLYQRLCACAKQQGEAVAATLGVPLLGVYSMTPKWTLPFTESEANKYGGPERALS